MPLAIFGRASYPISKVFLKAMAETGQIKLYGEHPTLTETAFYRARRRIFKEERFMVSGGNCLQHGCQQCICAGYSSIIMTPLGWFGGVGGLVVSTVMNLFARAPMAKVHEVGGEEAHQILYGHYSCAYIQWLSESKLWSAPAVGLLHLRLKYYYKER